MSKPIRVAVIHDWLTGMRGGEAVLEAITDLFRDPELFTLLYVPGSVSEELASLPRHTSRLQEIPGAAKHYRKFLPLMPQLIEGLDLSGFDLVVSSSHCVAKGVRKDPEAVHLSYIHAPMRYIWDRFDDYFGPGRASLPVRLAARAFRRRLQNWDRSVSSEARIDRLIGNSRFIADRIEEHYGRPAGVIHPFANLNRFKKERQPGASYLMVGAFAPYKRVDLAIEAFNEMQLPLQIVGKGQDEERLRRLAGPTVELLGPLDNDSVEDLLSKARAFVFPGQEDFGITPLEAMGAGCPVVAYGSGGAMDTVVDGKTGLLFQPQTKDALKAAIGKIESGEMSFSPAICRESVQDFTRERFQSEMLAELRETWVRRGRDAESLAAALSCPPA